jgi:hypothetical protein
MPLGRLELEQRGTKMTLKEKSEKVWELGMKLPILKDFCQSEDHPSAKFSGFFFIDCGCCLFWRGLIIGLLFGIASSYTVLSLIRLMEK